MKYLLGDRHIGFGAELTEVQQNCSLECKVRLGGNGKMIGSKVQCSAFIGAYSIYTKLSMDNILCIVKVYYT